ncbi:MAG: flagellar hook-basal body complex protein FliE [Deltaproteobacteria bacterium]|nr:MAG: flagellar hook-basal body complex protein FliE [Deltaproteobacteria bacterium 13_1_40CM_3_71_4]TMB46431.1 MAG: flagellar hook-basal body complex protein FliE [Deltaproteobacteria bacterium]TMB55071.1 MAG: flagellar hook-basal body complex protein FliE [Deltaproteobacteria bacterium]
MDVTRIGVPVAPAGDAATGATGATGAAKGPGSFGEVLKDSLAQVNHLQHEADGAIQQLATGGTATLHDTMLTIEKAELSFRLMMQVRNKIVEAYQEVLRMQV